MATPDPCDECGHDRAEHSKRGECTAEVKTGYAGYPIECQCCQFRSTERTLRQRAAIRKLEVKYQAGKKARGRPRKVVQPSEVN